MGGDWLGVKGPEPNEVPPGGDNFLDTRLTPEEEARRAQGRQNAKRYEDGIIWLLTKIRWTDTGQKILGALAEASKKRKKRVLFEPYKKWEKFAMDGQNDGYKMCNAEAAPDNPSDMDLKNAVQNGFDRVTVFFSRDAWESAVCAEENKLAGRRPNKADEVLLHECVHAYGELRGTTPARLRDGEMKRIVRATNPAYDNLEEYLAILLANIYRSELGRPGPLYFEHVFLARGPEKTTGVDATSEGFLGQVWNTNTSNPFVRNAKQFQILALSKLYLQERMLFDDLRQVEARFNPIRQYLAYKDIYDKEVAPG
jgi:hypothetical protein